MTWVRARPGSSRRSASRPSTTRSALTSTVTRPGDRNAASATECAPRRVGLAAVAGTEDPYLRRQLRRHVLDRLAAGHQPVRDMPADSVASLDRPDPAGELPPGREHLRIASLAGAIPARGQHSRLVVDNLDRRRPLMRIHPDDHAYD